MIRFSTSGTSVLQCEVEIVVSKHEGGQCWDERHCLLLPHAVLATPQLQSQPPASGLSFPSLSSPPFPSLSELADSPFCWHHRFVLNLRLPTSIGVLFASITCSLLSLLARCCATNFFRLNKTTNDLPCVRSHLTG